MPLNLPPLNALRAFEAAARTGSYVAAAFELHVSPAAVSQHVRNLEDYLGKKLFSRHNNRVVLTDAGQAVQAGISESLLSISTLTEQVKSGTTRSRLVISCVSSFAERWLVPRLVGYSLQHNPVRFDLRIEDDPVDFARHKIDLRISYGTGLYPEMISTQLLQDEVMPLCSEAYFVRNPRARTLKMEAVPDEDLIHTNWGPSFMSHPTWQEWFAKTGVARPVATKGYQVGMSNLALNLARDGLGVALGQRSMAAEELKAGRLVPVSETSVALGQPYCLVQPKNKSQRAAISKLIEWIVA